MSETAPKGSGKSVAAPKATYTRTQLINSTRHFTAVERDILTVVLSEDKKYTLEQARAAINQFKNREVN